MLDRVQTKAAQSTNHTMDSDWETLVQRRMIARLRALFNLLATDLFQILAHPVFKM